MVISEVLKARLLRLLLPTLSTRTDQLHSKANGASTGGNARPNLLIGHLPLSGSGQNDLYQVYGNFFYDNPTENLMQAEGNLAVHDNTMVNPHGGALNIQPHNDVPRQVDVFFNTVVTSGSPGIRVQGADERFDQRVRYNAVYGGGISAADSLGDVVGDSAAAVAALVDATSAPGDGLDLHPIGAALEVSILSGELPDLAHAMLDYDERIREGEHAGAYDGPAASGSLPLELTARSLDRAHGRPSGCARARSTPGRCRPRCGRR